MMAIPDLLTAFLIALSVTTSTAQDAPCTLPFEQTTMCQCTGTNVTCNRWPLGKIPTGTTSLTISGTNTMYLTLNKRWNTFLPHLRTLNLSSNKISIIKKDWFSRTVFPVLEELILDNNNLTLADVNMFASVSPSLRLLSLDRALNRNQTLVVDNLRDIIIQTDFANLEVLRLDNNNIVFLFPFTQLPKGFKFQQLEMFSLHNSSLIGLSNGTFPKKVFPRLQFLDLSGNEFVNIDQGLEDFKSYTDLAINLSDNPFYCNCKLIDFQTWLNSTNLVVNKEGLLCEDAYNKTSIGKKILEASLQCAAGPEELDIDNELQPSYIILSVILGLVGLLALAVLYMRRNDIKEYFVDLYTNTKEAFNSRQGYDDINRVRRDTPDMTPTEV